MAAISAEILRLHSLIENSPHLTDAAREGMADLVTHLMSDLAYHCGLLLDSEGDHVRLARLHAVEGQLRRVHFHLIAYTDLSGWAGVPEHKCIKYRAQAYASGIALAKLVA